MPTANHLRTQVLIPEQWVLLQLGEHIACVSPQQIVYAVLNGNNILSIGKGKRRLQNLRRNRRCPKHNKAFIVAAAPVVFGSENEFYYLTCDDEDEACQQEDELHGVYGEINLTVNQNGAAIENLFHAAEYLWSQIKNGHQIDPELEAQMKIVLHEGDALRVLLNTLHNNQLAGLLNNYFIVHN